MADIKKIKVGIRGSKLSKTQTDLFIKQAVRLTPGLDVNSFEIKTIQTTGDIHKSHRLDQIGGKGLFVKEIEEQLMSDEIDVGIHSMKDIPASETYPELDIICWMQRNQANDILISNSGMGLKDLPNGSIIGTSSIRRRAQVLHSRKDLSIKLLRGNVDTRVEKLKRNEYDAIILSLAGLQRLGMQDLVSEVLDNEKFLPAANQGAIGVQAKRSGPLSELFKNTNHEQTQIECLTERKVLHTINANCNSPVSVFANLIQQNINLNCEIFDHSGDKIYENKISGHKDSNIELGYEMGCDILKKVGQKKIAQLDNLENDFNYTPKI
ncbi:hydroxymethylbilane synthase [Pelagibacteraceae bacterium]|nr:hydroxymethylbilane synthase [Pelagibacteraceae bacterium]